MKYVSLFTGSGGLDIGLERAGFEPLLFCEKDKPCRKVLAERWPATPIIEDIALVDGSEITERPDLLSGGFPCQDLSYAGKRAGLDGDRSGLWFEMARCIRLLQPRVVLVENVPGLMRPVHGGSGIAPLGVVLADLAELGYDARWGRLRAADVGAPHLRSRVFVVAWDRALADSVSERQNGSGDDGGTRGAWRRRIVSAGSAQTLADAGSRRGWWDGGAPSREEEYSGWTQSSNSDGIGVGSEDVADTDRRRRELVGESEPQGIKSEARSESDGRSEVRRLEDTSTTSDADGERGKPGKRRRAQGGTDARTRAKEHDGSGHVGSTKHGPAVEVDANADAAGRGELERAGTEGREESDAPRGGSGSDGDIATTADADDSGRSEQRRSESVRAEQRSTECGSDEDDADADGTCGGQREGAILEVQGGEVPGRETFESGGCDRGGQGVVDWGVFEPAIRRWESLTRAAPRPTDDLGRLNARFSEWMLGYPAGWVDVKGVSRTAQLRMLGNSVQVQVGEAIGRHVYDLLGELS